MITLKQTKTLASIIQHAQQVLQLLQTRPQLLDFYDPDMVEQLQKNGLKITEEELAKANLAAFDAKIDKIEKKLRKIIQEYME